MALPTPSFQDPLAQHLWTPNPHPPVQTHPRDRLDSTVTHAALSNPYRRRRKFILCFDGTGNKFSGTDADSNILKIYRMLDRSDNDQFHYYQPGIGTYVVASSMSHTSRVERVKSWYAKAKDSAVGTSFDAHVMGGYKFLMRYYLAGDDIYLFGFSRGAYTARFLAEMLDHIGLLSTGNEEMCRFAWKTFQKWQYRRERNASERASKRALLDFMCAFRETFSRPVKPIRFLGLFDTVNSVPRFENAWMQRGKFPYTARSSARVIRHAVSIDERRAKFRQDLISESKPGRRALQYHERHRRGRVASAVRGNGDADGGPKVEKADGRRATLAVPEVYRDQSETAGVQRQSYSTGRNSAATSVSNFSLDAIQHYDNSDSDGEGEQDIREVWFAGCHADIGGGWPLGSGEDSALSHVPLVWMVREAQRAGLSFDQVKLRALNCCPEPKFAVGDSQKTTLAPVPTIEIDSPQQERSVSPFGQRSPRSSSPDPDHITPEPAHTLDIEIENTTPAPAPPQDAQDHEKNENDTDHDHTPFHTLLHRASTHGHIHDVLQRRQGASTLSVLCWNMMEFLPFRRMDLQEDGSWKSIRWPLPKGEVRDIPADAVIHCSVLRRMDADPKYRPGNLIVGGGGRGVRRAPEEMGKGKWVVCCEEGDVVGECFVRKEKPERRRSGEGFVPIGMGPGGPQGMFISGR